MDRKRTVAAAGGISVLLVAGSSAFAFANGIFVAEPVRRDTNLKALQARLVPETGATPTAAVAHRARHAAGRASGKDGNAVTAVRNAPPVSRVHEIVPTAMPETAATPAAISEPTIVPAVARATAPVVAHSGASTVPGQHVEDDHEFEHEEDGHSDD